MRKIGGNKNERGDHIKRPKSPTRAQKEIIRNNNLNWKNWAVAEETEFYLKIVNKQTGSRKCLDKYRKRR